MEFCKSVSLRLILLSILSIAAYTANAENNAETAKTIEPIEQQKRSARSVGEKTEIPVNPSAVDKDLDALPKNKRQVGGLYQLCLQRCVLRSNSPFCDACIELIKDVVPTPRARYGGSALSGRYLGCQCTREKNYVCGVNGYSYTNPCFAACAGATVAYEGRCLSDCACTKEYRPVCGVSGTTHSNECIARCNGDSVRFLGKCRFGVMGRESPVFCGCTKEYNPVCGVSGTTHSNPCIARCNGDSIRFYGKCRFGVMGRESPVFCGCTKEYRPVCGVSGTTHSNECIARCNGDKVRFMGQCRFRMTGRDYPPMQQCACPLLHWPVCGTNGVEYGNECELKCEGASYAWDKYQPGGGMRSCRYVGNGFYY